MRASAKKKRSVKNSRAARGKKGRVFLSPTWRRRLKKLGWIFFAILFLVWAAAFSYWQGWPQKAGSALKDRVIAAGAQSGLTIENLTVEGRDFTEPESILTAIGFEKGSALYQIDLKQARENLVALPWVREADLFRRPPDGVHVVLYEKVPTALFEKEESLFLLDQDGAIIPDQDTDLFADLMVVSGRDAPEDLQSLMAALQTQRNIYNRVEAAKRVSRRRWNLYIFQNGIVRLPENDLTNALALLQEMQMEEQLLDRSFEFVDMRNLEKITVKFAEKKAERVNSAPGPR
jgi:cell division protein FtsQ